MTAPGDWAGTPSMLLLLPSSSAFSSSPSAALFILLRWSIRPERAESKEKAIRHLMKTLDDILWIGSGDASERI